MNILLDLVFTYAVFLFFQIFLLFSGLCGNFWLQIFVEFVLDFKRNLCCEFLQKRWPRKKIDVFYLLAAAGFFRITNN